MTRFSQKRTHPNEIFPAPEDYELVGENPPVFVWLKDKENPDQEYRVVLRDENGEEQTFFAKKPYFRPQKMLQPGVYTWNVYSGDVERGWQHFTLAENAIEFLPPTAEEIYNAIPETQHPRALFAAKDIPEILTLRATELEVLKRNVALALAEGIPEAPYLKNTDTTARYHHARAWIGKIREIADRNLIACGLLWQLRKDSKAGEMGKKILLTLAAWDLEDTFVSAFYPFDEVGLSLARTLPAAFDLLYDVLTESEREGILRAMAQIAAQCYRRITEEDYEGNPGNSHAGRLPAYLAEAAMMLKGYLPKEKILQYLTVATDIYGGIFPHYGSADGGWGEGAFYGASYTKWYLPFFLSVERLTGKSYLNRPFYQNVSNFFLHFADPDFENHPFGDGYWCHSEDQEWPGFFAQNPFRVYAEKFGPEEAQKKQKEMPLPEIFRLHLLDIFLPAQKKPKHSVSQPAQLAAAFAQTGVFSMRSGFEIAECMAVMGRASRFGSASHSHADQGSFALFYEGVSLITPSGYYGAGWSTDHHQKWTKQTKAHNTILVDGEGMPAPSEKCTGKIEFCRQDGEIFTAQMNLNSAYEQIDHWQRNFTMDTASTTLVVEDDISADTPHTLSWLLHSLSEPFAEDGSVTICRKGITLKIEILTGLLPDVEITDQFETDLNAGALGDPLKFHAPKQYHMKWRTNKAKTHKIAVKFTIQT